MDKLFKIKGQSHDKDFLHLCIWNDFVLYYNEYTLSNNFIHSPETVTISIIIKTATLPYPFVNLKKIIPIKSITTN